MMDDMGTMPMGDEEEKMADEAEAEETMPMGDESDADAEEAGADSEAAAE